MNNITQNFNEPFTLEKAGQEEYERIGNLYKSAVNGIKAYAQKYGMTKVTLGASGGIDSAIVLTMAADALGGENVLGVAMPSEFSSDHSINDARNLMKSLGGYFRIIPIKDLVKTFQNTMSFTGIAEENLQARIRGVLIMGVSNMEGYLVLAPGNKSELAVGYSTIYGDAVGGYAPIKYVYKTDVFKMAEWRNQQQDSPIPESSITKPPSAELRPNQLDTESLPDYATLDAFLEALIDRGESMSTLVQEFGETFTKEIIAKYNRAAWKRQQYPSGPHLSAGFSDLSLMR